MYPHVQVCTTIEWPEHLAVFFSETEGAVGPTSLMCIYHLGLSNELIVVPGSP